MKKIFNIITLLSLLCTSILADDNLKKLKILYDNHEVKKHQTWKNWKNKSIVNRISITPENVIEYIKMDNKIYGYDDIPKQIQIDQDLKKNLIDALNELPKQIIKQMEERLIGIFLLSGLGSTGFSEHVYKNGEYNGGFIILDQDVLLNIKANEWATWRVNSTLQKDSDYKLSLKIEENSTNNRKQAIQFILIHEIAHIIGLSNNAHPKTAKGDPKNFPFSSLSWNSFEESKFDTNFKHRKDIEFYSFKNAKLNIKDANSIIKELHDANFCSVYGASSYFEDFAEAYTIYVHTILMNKPYSLKLYQNNKAIQVFENPFEMKNFEKKKEYIERLIQIKK